MATMTVQPCESVEVINADISNPFELEQLSNDYIRQLRQQNLIRNSSFQHPKSRVFTATVPKRHAAAYGFREDSVECDRCDKLMSVLQEHLILRPTRDFGFQGVMAVEYEGLVFCSKECFYSMLKAKESEHISEILINQCQDHWNATQQSRQRLPPPYQRREEEDGEDMSIILEPHTKQPDIERKTRRARPNPVEC